MSYPQNLKDCCIEATDLVRLALKSRIRGRRAVLNFLIVMDSLSSNRDCGHFLALKMTYAHREKFYISWALWTF